MNKDLYSKTVYSSTNNSYRRFEDRHVSPHRRKCIDGRVTGCGKCVGYCKYRGHPGYLTKELRKSHNCIQKGCFYYLPKEKQEPLTIQSTFTNKLMAFYEFG